MNCPQCGWPNDESMGLGQCIHLIPEVVQKFMSGDPPRDIQAGRYYDIEGRSGWFMPANEHKIPFGVECWVSGPGYTDRYERVEEVQYGLSVNQMKNLIKKSGRTLFWWDPSKVRY